MIKRLIEQERAIEEYAFRKRDQSMSLEGHWPIIRELVELLEPMEELTRLFCLPTSSIAVKFPYSKMAEQKVSKMQLKDPDVCKIRDAIAVGLRERFNDMKTDRLY
jgi:phosphohistidine phosphatase SixA